MSTPSRKRRAPGASPLEQETTSTQQQYGYPQMPENDFGGAFDFNQQYSADQGFSDPSNLDANNFAAALNAQQGNTFGNVNAAAPLSTDLVRRARSQQLVPPNTGQEQWNGYGGAANGQLDDEDEQNLDAKVQMAKREAQGKRKQIPPFVQKLSSFLDDGNHNQDLIRWSDDGRSFIVVDEDEFARTLIPELFKHNNYASFVRQLNMYGFHKTVNITDGSLRQSEKARKGVKPPSMYSHPYFRRNRPDLLWLIQKPSTKSAKRKRDGDMKGQLDSDDERQFSPGPEGRPTAELGAPGGGTQDITTLPRGELASVRQEIQKLQTQQKMISRMISQLKEQNDQFYRQATAFQQLHDRHENSINAILTFLATFYNRSLEGHAGQNLVNMFSGAGQHNTQQGSVVEDFTDTPTDTSNQVQRLPKRPPLLLTAPPPSNFYNLQPPGSAVTAPASNRSSVSPADNIKRSQSAQPEGLRKGSAGTAMTDSPRIKDDAPTPDVLHQAPESDQMMSLINSVNATNASTPSTAAPAFDFSSALEHYQNANGNTPLTPQQRDDMLALIANQQSGEAGNNNALMSKAPTMPDMEGLQKSRQQLNLLENLQKEQDAKLQRLNSQLQPLSPTGTIPGLANADNDGNYFDPTGAPGDFDPSAFIDFDAANAGNYDDINFNFNDNGVGNGDGIDWNFGDGSNNVTDDNMFASNTVGDTSHLAPPTTEADGGGRVESVSSEATSPAQTIEGGSEEPGTPSRKRARQSS